MIRFSFLFLFDFYSIGILACSLVLASFILRWIFSRIRVVSSSSSSSWVVVESTRRLLSLLPLCLEFETGERESCRWRWSRRDEEVGDRERRWRRDEPELNQRKYYILITKHLLIEIHSDQDHRNEKFWTSTDQVNFFSPRRGGCVGEGSFSP